MVKTTDILEACRLQVFGPRHTFGLNLLCQHNGVQMKSSSGCEAVRMAAQGRWKELLDYCADDVRILCDLYRRKQLRNPRGWDTIDLQRIAPDGLYAEPQAAPPAEDGRLRAQCAELQRQCAELQRQVQDLQHQVQVQEIQLEVYKSVCTCLDAFGQDAPHDAL